jgi:hypothetical protein
VRPAGAARRGGDPALLLADLPPVTPTPGGHGADTTPERVAAASDGMTRLARVVKTPLPMPSTDPAATMAVPEAAVAVSSSSPAAADAPPPAPPPDRVLAGMARGLGLSPEDLDETDAAALGERLGQLLSPDHRRDPAIAGLAQRRLRAAARGTRRPGPQQSAQHHAEQRGSAARAVRPAPAGLPGQPPVFPDLPGRTGPNTSGRLMLPFGPLRTDTGQRTGPRGHRAGGVGREPHWPIAELAQGQAVGPLRRALGQPSILAATPAGQILRRHLRWRNGSRRQRGRELIRSALRQLEISGPCAHSPADQQLARQDEREAGAVDPDRTRFPSGLAFPYGNDQRQHAGAGRLR